MSGTPAARLRTRPATAVVIAVLGAAVIALAAVALFGGGGGAPNGDASEHGAQAAVSPYFDAAFTVHDNAHTFGQSPTFTNADAVLSQEDDATGVQQVYRSQLDGSHTVCLTCAHVRGPNGFAAQQPGGGWILFCSYGAQPMHFGAPGLGGYGGDLYVMRGDGSEATRLTAASDPNGGVAFDAPGGIPYDNYHPYWSPDGKHIAWVRTEAHALAAGGQTWEIMLGTFVAPTGGAPSRLEDVRVVGPAYGVYETQHWAPDGSGFLFTAFGPRNSPYQATPPGWMHQELYFMRLYGHGASPTRPLVTLITDDLPVYQEQAMFTPDMRDVIFMTNRSSPDDSWYDAVIAAAQRTKFDAPDAGSVGTPQFLADFADPAFRAQLYMVDIRTRDLRHLTDLPRVVIPEFNWDSRYRRILWTVTTVDGKQRHITQLGTFPGLAPGAPPRAAGAPAPGLYGTPIDMGRVSAEIAAGHATGTAAPAVIAAAPSRAAAVATSKSANAQTLPPVVTTYATLWLEQLAQLGKEAGAAIATPSIS